MSLPQFKMPSHFRAWVQEKWFEHKDEILSWEHREPNYTMEDYIKKNKWLLRKMYRDEGYLEQFLEENHKKLQKEVKRGLKKGNL